MKKNSLIALALICPFLNSALHAPAYAAQCDLTINGTKDRTFYTPVDSLTFEFDVTDATDNKFKFSFPGCPLCGQPEVTKVDGKVSNKQNRIKPYDVGDYTVGLLWLTGQELCRADSYSYTIKYSPCSIKISSNNEKADVNSKFTVEVTKLPLTTYRTILSIKPGNQTFDQRISGTQFTQKIGHLPKGNNSIEVLINSTSVCSEILPVGEKDTPLVPGGQGAKGKTCDKCGGDCPNNQPKPPPDYDDCMKCFKTGTEPEKYGPGSWSALGCIPTGPEKFIQWLLNSAINIVGGLAFLMILFGSLKVATSSGNPEALNEGKEIIFAALAGLLFIVFSVILLKIIGHDILQIPGFSG